jgi:hypothetical protein
MSEAVSFRTALDKARQKHRPSWLYHLAVPLMLVLGLALGQGKLDQLFAAIFLLSAAVWAISESHVFGLAVDLAAGLDALEETVSALQSEIASLRSEVTQSPR